MERERDGEARRRAALEALVLAGEIESAAADVASPSAALAARLTDALAHAALGGDAAVQDACRALASKASAERFCIVPPEGFAYYGVHPESYAVAALENAQHERDVFVVGVRSIGTTLSAIALRALLDRGVRAKRLTVRPSGAYDDRELRIEGRALDEVRRARDAGALFLIVDEGPGRSGSTFLATADALVRAGVNRARVVVVCSHPFDRARLSARDAAARYGELRVVVAPAIERGARTGTDVSAGRWRAHHYADDSAWPASWPEVERRKILTADSRLLKYEGLGSAAAEARDRAAALADAGLTPPIADSGEGWSSSPWMGRPLSIFNRSDELLDRIAAYCAQRSRLFSTSADPTDLAPVIEHNARALFDGRASPIRLHVERPVIADARLAPHEWIKTDDGRVLKTDATAHGDDHFFPGPTDAAWDVAGAVVEWDLDSAERARFVARYDAASGDDVAPRLDAWILAYAVLSAARLTFARDASSADAERARLSREAHRARLRCARILRTRLT